MSLKTKTWVLLSGIVFLLYAVLGRAVIEVQADAVTRGHPRERLVEHVDHGQTLRGGRGEKSGFTGKPSNEELLAVPPR